MNAHTDPPSMFTAILWSTALSVVITGVAMIAVHSVLAERHAERAIRRVAVETCSQIADSLSEDIWKVDDVAISEYFSRYPAPMSLTSVEVFTEFGDLIFSARFRRDGVAEAGAIVETRDVTRNGERIGSVKVAYDREFVNLIRRRIVLSNATVIVAGLLVLALAAAVLGRIIVRRPLEELTQAIDRIGAADYTVELPAMPYRELQGIATRIEAMAGQIRLRTQRLEEEVRERTKAQSDLKSLTEMLEDEVSARVSELRTINAALQAEVRERRRAQDEMLRVSSREQQRIGQDLHDTLGQQMAGIAFAAGALARQLRSANREEAAVAEQIVELLSQAVSQIRRIGHGLAPIETLDYSLHSALRQLAQESRDLFGMACEVAWSGDDVRDVQVATQLYRIVQEAIHNARRHGHAKRALISFAREGATCRLAIEDDGVGFDAGGTAAGGMGLRIMRYRAEAVRGACTVTSTPGKGAIVSIAIPSD